MPGQQTWNLIGGGLANCLLALRLEAEGIPFLLFERSSQLAGNHTWSFHENDLDREDLRFLEPLVSHSWNGYDVHFPNYSRHFQSSYFSLRSEDLRAAVQRQVPAHKIRLNSTVEDLTADGLSIDARGFTSQPLFCGWQKFVGWDVVFEAPHGLKKPVIMDAAVEQRDGYRFIYLLPLDSHTLLVEDTRYSLDPGIDESEFDSCLCQYIDSRWSSPWVILRKEKAALPIPLRSPSWRGRFGVAGGFFHPVTGYSLPYALRVSRELIALVQGGQSVADAWWVLHKRHSRHQNYYLALNRMLFLAAPPDQRWRIFDRFYRLDEGLIQRFYAGQSSAWDKIRLLSGRPPVRVDSAIRALLTPTVEQGAAWN